MTSYSKQVRGTVSHVYKHSFIFINMSIYSYLRSNYCEHALKVCYSSALNALSIEFLEIWLTSICVSFSWFYPGQLVYPALSSSIECTLFLSLLSCLFFFGCRRFIWNFFRLENEHLNNCGQFRAVRDISVVPIDTGDQALLEQLMDDIDGQVFSTRKSRRKSSIIMKSLRKFSSRPEGNRVDDIIVIDIDRETQV